MSVDPANAQDPARTASEVGADVFKGDLCYPSETGGWMLGDLDFCEYLDRYRNQQVIVIIARVGSAPTPSFTCGICGFVYNEYGECPRCKMASEQGLLRLPDDSEDQDILDQVKRFLENRGRDQS